MPSEVDERNAAAGQFVAALGGAMAAANYPVTMVRAVMEQTSRAYGLDHQFLALPNYVQVGSPTGEGMFIANPDFDVRFDQSFPLARLVAQAPAGTVSPEEGMAPSLTEFVTSAGDFRSGSRSRAMPCKAQGSR